MHLLVEAAQTNHTGAPCLLGDFCHSKLAETKDLAVPELQSILRKLPTWTSPLHSLRTGSVAVTVLVVPLSEVEEVKYYKLSARSR